MSRVSVHGFSVSLDGFGAGPDQSLDHPLGRGGKALHDWMFATRTGRSMIGEEGGQIGVDDEFVARGFDHVGAWVIGRNMFGPIRGPWPDEAWRGWWGENPPFHAPVFVLTHHPREPITMQGGTIFHFVTDGIKAAVRQAETASGGKDIRIGGGADTIRQYLNAQSIDELHLAVTPTILGSGKALFDGLDLLRLGYRCVKHVPGARAMHVVLGRKL